MKKEETQSLLGENVMRPFYSCFLKDVQINLIEYLNMTHCFTHRGMRVMQYHDSFMTVFFLYKIMGRLRIKPKSDIF